jgi:hypothetical protein
MQQLMRVSGHAAAVVNGPEQRRVMRTRYSPFGLSDQSRRLDFANVTARFEQRKPRILADDLG